MSRKRAVLPIIVFSQFCCTSLWFAGNGVMNDLLQNFGLPSNALGHLTSAVQFGFITGTLIFAFLGIADRFSPSKVFLGCAISGAIFNLGVAMEENTLPTLLLLRFLTGFSLAGIYPVGMKIAADYFEKGLGRSLGYLVGALVLGTALPHLLKTLTGTGQLPWMMVLYSTSALSLLGGALIYFLVPDGPFRKSMKRASFSSFLKVFRIKEFRRAAFGYFGHMWELYTFWAFVPVILSTYSILHPATEFSIPLLSFFIIGCGAISCVAGGYISQRYGVKRTAAGALFISGCCCLLSPFFLLQESALVFTAFLILWGLAVVADSPLFSTLVARHVPAEVRGSALTIVNSIGFFLTIISIQTITLLHEVTGIVYLLVYLAIGPAFGLYALYRNK